MSGFDAQRFKAIERAGFDRIARRYLDAAAARSELQSALIDLADPQPGEAALDLASGPCLLAAVLAARVGDAGLAVASDLSERMLSTGRDALDPALAARLGCCVADAEALPFADASFDLVTMGLGLFALPEPERALAHVRRVLRPGGRLAVSVWGPREAVPLIYHAQDCIARILPAPRVPRPSVFRLGEHQVLASLLVRGGLRPLRIESISLRCRFDSAAAYWQAFLDLAGGATEALARLPENTRSRLAEAVEVELAGRRQAEGYVTDSEVVLALASIQ